MLVAGEASGDALGAELMAALRASHPDLVFSGVGGEAMAAAGLASLFPMRELSVMGLAEILPRAFGLLRRIAETAAHARAARPDVIVTIDSPGFNFRLAERLRRSDLALVHYVAPQVWAWRPGRAAGIVPLFDHMLALLPFEPPLFAAHGLPCSFVGHPAAERLAAPGDAAGFRQRLGIAAEAPLLLLLPGSRAGLLGRLLPVLLAANRRLRESLPTLASAIVVAPAVDALVRRAVARAPRPPAIVPAGERHHAFAAAAGQGAAIAASGTATLELALAGVPTVVTYRANPLTAFLVRRLIRLKHVALPNILLGESVLPELLQQDCAPQPLADAAGRLLSDPAAALAQCQATACLRGMLRPAGAAPSVRAAAVVLEVMRTGRRPR